MQSDKIRCSNFELLRIVAMFLVFAVHANFLALGQPTASEVSQSLISSFCRIFFHQIALVCVNLFVLISGYFGIHPTIRSVSNLLFAVMFWQAASWIVGHPDMGLGAFLLLPCRGWFVGTYLELMLIAPLINGFVDASGRKFASYLCVFLCVEIVLSSFCPIWPAFHGGYSLLHLIGIYLIGRYIRLSDSLWLRCGITTYGSMAIVISLVSAIFVCASTAHMAQMPLYASAVVEKMLTKLFHEYSSFPVVASSVCIFLAFKNLRFYSKTVNLSLNLHFRCIYFIIIYMIGGRADRYFAIGSNPYFMGMMVSRQYYIFWG